MDASIPPSFVCNSPKWLDQRYENLIDFFSFKKKINIILPQIGQFYTGVSML